MAATPLKIGIISLGEMGLGIAKLLTANSFHVATNTAGRSPNTIRRAESAKVECLSDDTALIQSTDLLLSIVPPRDALETARRIADALQTNEAARIRLKTYLDLNAVSPQRGRDIASIFAALPAGKQIGFIDGGIIGGPPEAGDNGSWSKPSIFVSGPGAAALDPRLFSVLNMRNVGPDIGKASGLKMCFASLTKGMTAIAIQSFTTADRLGVLEELQYHLESFSPAAGKQAQRGLVNMPTKAYRFVDEMKEISSTFKDDGRFEGVGGDMFEEVAKVYDLVANETILGKEQQGNRKRGTTAEDVAKAMNERKTA